MIMAPTTPLRSESVYESAKGIAAVPSHFVPKDPIPQAVNIDKNNGDEISIPVIDYRKLTNGAPEEQARALQQLTLALEDWGFFQLVNHGIPESLRVDLMKAIKGFFDLPTEEKQKYQDRFLETKIIAPIRYGTSFNLKEDKVDYWRDYIKINVHPEFHCPTNPPEFSELLREFVHPTLEMARQMLNKVWECLGVDGEHTNEALKLTYGYQLLSLNLYPPCPEPEKVMSMPPHADQGLLTVLYQNEVDGLEAFIDGKWYRVKPLPNAFFINTGDHLEIVSNGKYRSMIHRAVPNRHEIRMSLAAFTGPAADAVVLPAPELVTDETPARFRGITYKEFVQKINEKALMDKSVLDTLRI